MPRTQHEVFAIILQETKKDSARSVGDIDANEDGRIPIDVFIPTASASNEGTHQVTVTRSPTCHTAPATGFVMGGSTLSRATRVRGSEETTLKNNTKARRAENMADIMDILGTTDTNSVRGEVEGKVSGQDTRCTAGFSTLVDPSRFGESLIHAKPREYEID